MGFFQRLKVAIGRVIEVNDDELGYAWHAANAPLEEIGVNYDREKCTGMYNRIVAGMYKRKHMDAAVHMVASAIGLRFTITFHAAIQKNSLVETEEILSVWSGVFLAISLVVVPLKRHF